jgi:hypothetical protein
MKKTITKLALVATCLVCAVSSQAWGASVIIDLQWSGVSFDNSATATGWMTVDAAAIPNPGQYTDFGLPSWLTDLSITVSGASSGNGTFALADFSNMYWNTEGGTLNLNTQLIGQSTSSVPWGTSQDGSSGDLNFFGSAPGAPLGTTFFTLTTSGGSGDRMVLTSASAGSVPEPATYSLLATALLGLLTLKRKRT